MTRAMVRYEVYVEGSKAYEMSPYMLGYSAGATRRTVLRADEPARFCTPSFVAVTGGLFHQPLPFEDEVARRTIESASTCHVVEYDAERQGSLWYLDAALALAADIAGQCKGVIVDRTADALVTRDVLEAMKKGVAARDTVSLRETSRGERVTLASVGMTKFGQADFVLVDFPRDLAEMGRRLIYDNLCSYSMGRAVLAGQTFGGGAVRMIFVEDGEGRLEVRDVHPQEKRALAGNDALVEGLRPIWEAQSAIEAAARSTEDLSRATRTRGGPAGSAASQSPRATRAAKPAKPATAAKATTREAATRPTRPTKGATRKK